MHLLLLLSLFWLSGTFGLSGPGAMRSQERDSVTVTCRYGSGWKTYIKYWCRGADWMSCKYIVRTSGSEQEVKNDRVSIRDNHRARAFTVTMKELKREDADTYYCGIEKCLSDLGHKVQVTVDPALASTSIASISTKMQTMSVTPIETNATPTVAVHHTEGRSLLCNVHFLFLIFLKVPLFLGMLSAVLWVNRPLRALKETLSLTSGTHSAVQQPHSHLSTDRLAQNEAVSGASP